ncbi:MAG: site-2 protease family protein [Planctomycetota bacterium]|jgi:regulator of sigma E protease
MSYVLIVFLVGLLILIHELGHFLAARWVGIPVERFSIGFGPKVCGIRRGRTEYWISAVPIGGYVMLDLEDEQAFFRISPGRRLLFFLGGPVANFLLPVPLFAILNVLGGDVSFHAVVVAPVIQTGETLAALLAVLPQLFNRPDAVSGVLGIVVQGGHFVGTDLAKAMQFAILLSLNLAVLNLLPIPVLDGGKILLLLLEKVHPKSVRLYVPLCLVGLVLILGLVAYTTVLDVRRLIM